jgi:hypothetical protein
MESGRATVIWYCITLNHCEVYVVRILSVLRRDPILPSAICPDRWLLLTAQTTKPCLSHPIRPFATTPTWRAIRYWRQHQREGRDAVGHPGHDLQESAAGPPWGGPFSRPLTRRSIGPPRMARVPWAFVPKDRAAYPVFNRAAGQPGTGTLPRMAHDPMPRMARGPSSGLLGLLPCA